MGDVIESMLRKAMTALMTNDRKLAAEVSRMDNITDRLDEAIKLYVTKVTRESLDDRDGHRAMEIISFSINLEHIGDIIDKNLMEIAIKKIKHKYEFSKEGAKELADFYKLILDNLRLAFSVFINGDVKIARKLISEKTQIRRQPIWRGCARAVRKASRRVPSISTSCVTSSAFTHISARSPIRSLRSRASCSLTDCERAILRRVEHRDGEADAIHPAIAGLDRRRAGRERALAPSARPQSHSEIESSASTQ
jgi:Na+/phosphate symporter